MSTHNDLMADALIAEVAKLRAELRGCTQNLDDACATLAKVEAERDALTVENLTLRNAAVNAEERSEALREEVSLRRHTMPAQYAKLIAERDTLQKERDHALEMVNVQDNQIDALRAALQIARSAIYSLDAREIYADELALIDAALGDKP